MRRIALGLLAGTSFLGLTSIASAADLGVRKAPPPLPPPVWSWTGFYIGAHLGAGWSTVEADAILPDDTVIPIVSHNINGFLGGVQGGFNWQAGFVVFGAEVQASFAGLDGSAPCVGVLLNLFTCRSETEWVLTVAGRLGVAIDRALVYVKGGVAWAESEHSAILRIGGGGPVLAFGPNDVDRWGVVFGAGVEYAFTPNWSAKLEYNYIDFDDERVAFRFTVDGVLVGDPVNTDIRQNLHLIKFGVNYKFDVFGAALPVGARY